MVENSGAKSTKHDPLIPIPAFMPVHQLPKFYTSILVRVQRPLEIREESVDPSV